MKVSLLKLLLVGAMLGALTTVTRAQEVTGAGASFPAPLYAKWAEAYTKVSGVRISYQSVGSGAGMRQIRGKTVDFGASDTPLTDGELTKEGLIQFPTVIGGVVPVINIKGIAPGQLKLTGTVLADIYLGRITRWNDPAIVALNSGVPLPEATIAVVRRADSSGTSFLFTNYLSKISPGWKAKVGDGITVSWPTGAGGKGNEGMSSHVLGLPNAIGYVEHAYAKQHKMTHVLMRNQAGNFVAPSQSSFKAAAAQTDWSKGFNHVLTDQAGKESWPITGATFVLMHVKQDKPHQAAAAIKFFDWAYTNGDDMAAELDYVSIPDNAKSNVRGQWRSVTDRAGKSVIQ